MQQICEALKQVIQNVFGREAEVLVTRPDEQFGDFATNVALQLAKEIGQYPREIAQAIVDHLSHEAIAKAEVAGPGFINITLTNQALIHLLRAGQEHPLKGKKVLVEYSDPNPFKPLHAGHLYTTLVGDSIARLIEQTGAETIRINYGGDVGLHVGKSMWAIIKHLGGDYPEKLNDIPVNERPKWLGERYVEGNAAYEEDETAKQEIINVNKGVYDIHNRGDEDSPFARIYWTTRKWSYDYFAELYRHLEVKEFSRFIPESEVTPLGLKTVQEQLEAGVFERSEGAVIFDGEKYGLHKRVFINSEGLPTYEAKDVGLSLTKWKDYQFDQSIIITAHEQAPYMKVVIKSIEQFAPEPAQRTWHLTHGTVKLQGGVKMSSRKGNVVMALDILEAARQAGEATGTSPDEQTVLAAVKYAFARNRIGSDIIYDPAESVALEGNSGPYLQYAHARACSILIKAGNSGEMSTDLQPDERNFLRKITEFQEVINLATDELMPHHIANYLYELAQKFNSFYEHNRVLGDEREQVRLSLVNTYQETLKHGLELLGINAPEHM